jgi:hypothetical protein
LKLLKLFPKSAYFVEKVRPMVVVVVVVVVVVCCWDPRNKQSLRGFSWLQPRGLTFGQ